MAATDAHGDAGWSVTGGTMSAHGPGRWTVTSSRNAVGVYAPAQHAVAGHVYTVGLPVQAGSAPRPVQGGLAFLDSAGARLMIRLGPPVTDRAARMMRTPAVTLIAPARTAKVRPVAVIWSGGPGVTTTFGTPVVSGRRGPASPIVGPLRVIGNRLYDRYGPIALRGLHRFGLEGGMNGTDNPPDLTDVEWARARAWGANVIRLSVNEQFWLRNNCHYDPAYRRRVDAAVNGITRRGMVALVDLHFSARGGHCDPIAPQRMADAANAPTFWRLVAARYKRNPLVMFDLYNEPHDISVPTWLSGGIVSYGGVTFRAAGMQQLYDAVRSTGARSVVLVSGPDWANTPPPARIHGYNVVYAVHAYTCPQGVNDTCQANPTDPAPILGRWLPVLRWAPVIISEFGWPDPRHGAYMRNVVAYAERHGFSGWVGFAWGGAGGGPLGLSVPGSPTAVAEPTATGMALLAGFAANIGPLGPRAPAPVPSAPGPVIPVPLPPYRLRRGPTDNESARVVPTT